MEIEAFKREEDLWSALVGPRRASLSVRPAVHRFVFVSVMVLVTGYAAYLTMLLNVDADETLRGNYIALTCFFLFVLGPAAVLASGIVSGWRYYVAYYRRARLFHEQHFKLIKATKERLFV
ncbi:MAG TPA: hypothetical protein VD862_02850 [Candidatus Paceibacterota bacterium]|nr:hypothetical protein [Candidatus Paceibacterota bacterium]